MSMNFLLSLLIEQEDYPYCYIDVRYINKKLNKFLTDNKIAFYDFSEEQGGTVFLADNKNFQIYLQQIQKKLISFLNIQKLNYQFFEQSKHNMHQNDDLELGGLWICLKKDVLELDEFKLPMIKVFELLSSFDDFKKEIGTDQIDFDESFMNFVLKKDKNNFIYQFLIDHFKQECLNFKEQLKEKNLLTKESYDLKILGYTDYTIWNLVFLSREEPDWILTHFGHLFEENSSNSIIVKK